MLYVSYGSNMNVEQMKWRCPNTVIVGNGRAYGWKLVFNYHADIIPSDNPDDYVPVVVWNVKRKKDLLSLDRYEGYPSYYVKEDIDVVMDSGEKITAMVYVMEKSRKGIFPPTKGYFDTIVEGYIENDISLEKLIEAVKYAIDSDNFTEYNQYNRKEDSDE